ncbi:MAG: hypothetical protein WBP46_02155 [Thiolinea sp.]
MANLLTARISATELARNLASIIDQVRVSRYRMVITRGNQDIAQITPVANQHFTLADLNTLLERNRLSAKERQAFSDDLKSIRQAAKLPASPWE